MVTTTTPSVAEAPLGGPVPGPAEDDGARTGSLRPGMRLHSVDGLRFLAALGVVLYHFMVRWSTVWGEHPGDRFPTSGRVMIYFALAPELFFVVSGFVILWTAWGRTVPQVVASRLARVYPAYWAALAMTSLLLLVIWPQGKRISLGEVAVNVTLMQEAFGVRNVDGVYWTLWTELRFYLLIAVFTAIGFTRRRVIAFAALWPPIALAVHALGWGFGSTLLISRYAPFFAGGMLLYLIFRDGHSRLLWSLVGLNVGLALYTTVPAQLATLREVTAFEPNGVVLGVLVVGLFAAVAATALTRLRNLGWPFLAVLGALTYPLYLIHQFWGWWVIHMLSPALPTALTLAAAVAVSVALACVIHFGVEKRYSPRARRWIERVLAGRPRARQTLKASAARPPAPAAANRP